MKISYKKIISFLTALLLFIPIMKSFVPFGNILPFVVLCIFFLILLNRKVFINDNFRSIMFLCIIFMCYGTLIGGLDITNLFVVEIIRYGYVITLSFMLYILVSNYGFSERQFVFMLCAMSSILLVCLQLKVIDQFGNLTYSQLSYGLVPLLALAFANIFYSYQILISLSLYAFVNFICFFVLGARSMVIVSLCIPIIILILKNHKLLFYYLCLLFLSGLGLRNYIGSSLSSLEILVVERLTRILTDVSDEPRFILYTRLWELFISEPLGYGFGGQEAISNSHAHNLILEFLLTFGIFIGFLTCILLIGLACLQVLTVSSYSEMFILFLSLYFLAIWQLSNDFGSAYFLMATYGVYFGNKRFKGGY